MTWKPYPEVYCLGCHRMVQGKYAPDIGQVIPGDHYRYTGSYETDPLGRRARFTTKCTGAYGITARHITHGMDDKAAAFYPDAVARNAAQAVTNTPAPVTVSGSTTSSGESPSARFWWKGSR